MRVGLFFKRFPGGGALSLRRCQQCRKTGLLNTGMSVRDRGNTSQSIRLLTLARGRLFMVGGTL
jgi:hypothetical protein